MVTGGKRDAKGGQTTPDDLDDDDDDNDENEDNDHDDHAVSGSVNYNIKNYWPLNPLRLDCNERAMLASCFYLHVASR